MEIITITVTDGEEIHEVHVFKHEQQEKLDGLSQNFRIFGPDCLGWEHDAEYNRMFLKSKERYANDLLRARGHVFLNEVYDMLGLPRTKIGQIIGWKLGSYIDFGIDAEINFYNGSYINKPLIDFNVDGVLLDYI